MHNTAILIPLLFAACAMDVEPEPEAAEVEASLDDVPCDLLKGPLPLFDPSPTPMFRYVEEFDLVAAQVDSPFQSMARDDYEAFRDSMTFNEHGQLVSYRYDVLRAALSAPEYERAGEVLGRSAKDHTDYYCEARATCRKAGGFICTTNC